MRFVEKITKWVRHRSPLKKWIGLWTVLRGPYRKFLSMWYPSGLLRVINGTDPIHVDFRWTSMPEVYEPSVWHEVMRRLSQAKLFVDIGGHIGLYAICGAQRMPEGGKVVVFEPLPKNGKFLRDNVRLNREDKKIEIRELAVGERSGTASMNENESQATLQADGAIVVRISTLDEEFPTETIDVLKIDVEGAEEKVLLGAKSILANKSRKPKSIFIEVHPYAWGAFGTRSEDFIKILKDAGYRLRRLDGQPLQEIDFYGEILAELEK